MGKIKTEQLMVIVTAIGVGRDLLDTARLAHAADRSAEVMLHNCLFSEVL